MNIFITCYEEEEEEEEEEDGIQTFCKLFDKYKTHFSLADFISLVNDYSRYDSMKNFPDYMKAI